MCHLKPIVRKANNFLSKNKFKKLNGVPGDVRDMDKSPMFSSQSNESETVEVSTLREKKRLIIGNQ